MLSAKFRGSISLTMWLPETANGGNNLSLLPSILESIPLET